MNELKKHKTIFHLLAFLTIRLEFRENSINIYLRNPEILEIHCCKFWFLQKQCFRDKLASIKIQST